LPGRAPSGRAPHVDVVVPGRLSVRQSPLPGGARRPGTVARVGIDGDPLRRRRRVPPPHGPPPRHLGGRGRSRVDLHPQGRNAQGRRATLSGRALRSGGRQAEDPGRGQGRLGRPGHDDLSPPGSVRSRREGLSSGRPDGRTHRRSLDSRPARDPVAGGDTMKATETLHERGQSLWLDNITRDLLESGTLARYIDELSVSGLTSNPTIFDHAIKNSSAYDAAIRRKVREGKSGEDLFFELALEDLTRAADLFRPIWDRTRGVDGWVSLEVSPLLAHDTASTLAAAKALHARAGRPNLLIKIPGTKEGLPAIEEAIFAGVPINVTLLFSSAHYLAAADAFMRGIERRVAGGLQPEIGSVASVFISRWDAAVKDRVPGALRNQLGIAI